MPVKKVKSRISRENLDALLVIEKCDIVYLAGFYTPSVAMLVTRKGPPVYFVDPMNRALVDKVLKGANLRIMTVSKSATRAVAEFIKDSRIKRLGYNGDVLSVSDHKKLTRLLPNVRMKSAPFVIREVRKIKTPDEVRVLRKAARDTVRIWREVKKRIKTGMTEREIAAMIDVKVRERGYENSFPTIAAIGENSAYPHAVPVGRRLKKDEHLLVDFGIKLNGYCSDLTRIWAGGRIMRKIGQLRKHVHTAHDRAIQRIKPGVNIGALVREANIYFKNNNLGEYVCHGLGHGIGLDVHEAPFLRDGSREKLKEGMVITIEPGLYIPGLGGIREEDMVLVTKKGCEVLTR
ncbi:MAG: M24 family metallopeptidase [Candidatus Omnitrophota bacterium]